MSRYSSIRNLRSSQAHQIKIRDRKCEDRQQRLCVNNDMLKEECYRCAVFMGNTALQIRFVASDTSNIVEDTTTSVIEKPKETIIQKIEPTIIDVDESDIFHYCKFVSEVITHQHSPKLKYHTHYKLHRFGDSCDLCGREVVGEIRCNICKTIFDGATLSKYIDEMFVKYDSESERLVFE